MKTNRKNEAGMTLVEVLAAITILAIVFVGFLSIYPQMTNFNAQTEAKLETMNLARVELSVWKDEAFDLNLNDSSVNIEQNNCELKITYEKETYDYEVLYDLNPDLGSYENQDDDMIRLNSVHIQVKKENKSDSEIFGYIENNNLFNDYLSGCNEVVAE